MRQLLSLTSGMVLLLALTGCHQYAGICDCDGFVSCDYGICPVGHGCAGGCGVAPTTVYAAPSATLIRPEPIKAPEKIESKEPEKAPTIKPSL